MPPTRAYTDAMFRHLLDSATELADARRGVLDAAAGCLRSAERLPPGQVAIFGTAVGDAIGALATAHAAGDAHGIETAARILSGLMHLSPAQVLAAGADTTGAAFFAALELLRACLQGGSPR